MPLMDQVLRPAGFVEGRGLLIRSGAGRLVYRPDTVGARVFAAQEAPRQARVGAAQQPYELHVQRAHRAVALGNLGKGTCIFVDEVVAAGFSVVNEAALLL